MITRKPPAYRAPPPYPYDSSLRSNTFLGEGIARRPVDWEYASSETPSYSTTVTDDLHPSLFTTVTTTTTTTTRHGEPEDFPDFRPVELPDYVTAVTLDPRDVGNPFFLTSPGAGPSSLYDLPSTLRHVNNPDWDPMMAYDPENTYVHYGPSAARVGCHENLPRVPSHPLAQVSGPAPARQPRAVQRLPRRVPSTAGRFAGVRRAHLPRAPWRVWAPDQPRVRRS